VYESVCIISVCGGSKVHVREIVRFAEIGWHGDPHAVTNEGALG
jgi:hypothetical protein